MSAIYVISTPINPYSELKFILESDVIKKYGYWSPKYSENFFYEDIFGNFYKQDFSGTLEIFPNDINNESNQPRIYFDSFKGPELTKINY